MKLILRLVLALILSPILQAGDAEVLAALKLKGAELTETKGVVTGLGFRDCTKIMASDFALIGHLTQLKSLNFGQGFNDEALKALGAMPAVESLSTNGMDVSDEGARALAAFKGLRSIAIFHPSKRLTGTGLAALATLPHLERLTVAGSATFADEGMAAVATLTQLKNFRTWHTGVTNAGVVKIGVLKQLTSIHLGQRLSYTPPTTLSDAALPVLAGLPLLEDITLNEARLSLGALSDLKKLSHLKRLTLTGIDLAESDLAKLQQQLPMTKVVWTAPDLSGQKRIAQLFK